MNPEALARLRHSLRTPLNQLIGYAELVRHEARVQGARAESDLMDQALEAARQVVDQVQAWLPVKAHVAGDVLPPLRAAVASRLPEIEKALASFEESSGGACAKEMRKMRDA